jgi:hypothetical protein
MDKKIEKQLQRLKAKVRKPYLQATDFDDLDCGRQMAEIIRPQIGVARLEVIELWKQIKELDPSAPPCPFSE